jgi:hypothetical protein
MIENYDLLKLVETGSTLTSALALTLLNQRTSGAILMVVSQMNEQIHAGDAGAKAHEG